MKPRENNVQEDLLLYDSFTESDSCADVKPPENIIDSIYKEMSKIIEKLNTDNMLMNEQIKKLRSELEFVSSTVSAIKSENQEIVTAYTSEFGCLMESVKKLNCEVNDLEEKHTHANTSELTATLTTKLNDTLLPDLQNKLIRDLQATVQSAIQVGLQSTIQKCTELQKQILDTRTMLVQMITTHINSIKKELNEVRKIKEDIRPYIKSIIAEEMKDYVSKLPSLEQKFEELSREHRANLAQHIRKSQINNIHL